MISLRKSSSFHLDRHSIISELCKGIARARIKSMVEKRVIVRRASTLVILTSSAGVGNRRDSRSKASASSFVGRFSASATNPILLFRLNFSRVGGGSVDFWISHWVLVCILFKSKLTKHHLSIVSPAFCMSIFTSLAIRTPANCHPVVASIVSDLGRHNHQPLA